MNVYLHLGKYIWTHVAPILVERGTWSRWLLADKMPRGAHPGHNEHHRRLGTHTYRAICPDIYDKMHPLLQQFMSMYARNNRFHMFGYSLKTIHDFLDIFNLQVNHYAATFADNEIDLVAFNRAPHTGADFIAYNVAKALGINTLILQQTGFFPQRFFHVFDHEDYGLFETSKLMEEPRQFRIEKKFEKDLHYMRDFYSRNSFRDRVKQSPEYQFLINIKRNGHIAESAFQYYRERLFRYWNRRLTCNQVDLTTDFVYFPLHFQPEANTTAWGGVYDDQLLAIERLSEKLPDGWKIFVKENPQQPGYMRGKWFYERLAGISNVQLVPISMNTYTLLEHCRFAATITGTIGWESITGGKPALIFGKGCWYRSLPGAIMFNRDFRVQDVMCAKIDHEELELAVGNLLARTGHGEVFKRMNEPNPRLADPENHELVADSIEKILA